MVCAAVRFGSGCKNAIFALLRKLFDLLIIFFYIMGNIFIFRIFGRLSPAFLTHKLLFSVMNVTVFYNILRTADRTEHIAPP